ncbi:hypothetical protein CHUAL_013247 [Chamberlinius hualienensis]
MDRTVLNLEEDRQNNLTAFKFRLKAALLYHSKYPPLSRSILAKSVTVGMGLTHRKPVKGQYDLCNYCGSILTPGKYICRLISKSKFGKYLKKLKEIQQKCSWRLNKYQERLLKKDKNCLTMTYRCLTCKRIAKRVEVNRDLHKQSILNKRDVHAKVEVFKPTNLQTAKKIRSSSTTPITLGTKVAPNVQLKKANFQTPLHTSTSNRPLSSNKKSKKKRSTVKSQIKQMLHFKEANTSCKSRLESFLSTI